MNNLVEKLIENSLPIAQEIADRRANCFNAVQLFYGDSDQLTFVGPEDFVSYIQNHFRQLSEQETQESNDVSIVWSRNSDILHVGQICVEYIRRERVGYPFGLIIEHSFVYLKDGVVFQKRDPTSLGPYETVSEESALSPYLLRNGLEITRHRRI